MDGSVGQFRYAMVTQSELELSFACKKVDTSNRVREKGGGEERESNNKQQRRALQFSLVAQASAVGLEGKVAHSRAPEAPGKMPGGSILSR